VGKELFAKNIINEAKAKFQREGLPKIDVKELIIITASHFNDELKSINDELKSELKSIKKAGWSIAIAIFTGIGVYIITRIIA